MAQKFIKDPQAILDYVIDWTAWLGSDTITTSAWTVPTGITKDSESSTTVTATVWLSGGTAGSVYELKNTIVTASGRKDERSIWIEARNK